MQKVKAEQRQNDIRVQCDFIMSSDAQGCMVALIGDIVNTTVNVTRCTSCSSGLLNLNSQSLSCYHEVFAFDIESDGSVGTLAISGKLILNPTSKMTAVSCIPGISSSESCMVM